MVQVEGMASAARLETGRPAKKAKHTHAIDFAKHFSEEGRLRQYPSLRKIICQFSGADDVVPMHGGLPPTDSFPLKSMLLRLKNGQTMDLIDEQKVRWYVWPPQLASVELYIDLWMPSCRLRLLSSIAPQFKGILLCILGVKRI